MGHPQIMIIIYIHIIYYIYTMPGFSVFCCCGDEMGWDFRNSQLRPASDLWSPVVCRGARAGVLEPHGEVTSASNGCLDGYLDGCLSDICCDMLWYSDVRHMLIYFGSSGLSGQSMYSRWFWTQRISWSYLDPPGIKVPSQNGYNLISCSATLPLPQTKR